MAYISDLPKTQGLPPAETESATPPSAPAGLGSVPLLGNALAVTFVTAVSWRLNQRREEWFTELAEAVEELRQRIDDLNLEDLADNDLFVDAVVSATRTIEHTHQAEKI